MKKLLIVIMALGLVACATNRKVEDQDRISTLESENASLRAINQQSVELNQVLNEMQRDNRQALREEMRWFFELLGSKERLHAPIRP